MKLKCCVCGAEREADTCTVLKTTESERAAIRRLGQEPKDEYVYCRPCYGVIGDRESGARLIQGIVQSQLRLSGNPRADAIAQRYYDFLIRKSGNPVS